MLNIPNERTGFSLYPFCGSDYNDNQEVGARNPDKEREGSNQEAGILPTERKRFLWKRKEYFHEEKVICVYNEKAQAIMKCWKNKDTE